MTEQIDIFTAAKPTFALPSGATDRERRTLNWLIKDCIGAQNAIPANELAVVVGITRRALRRTIHSMTVEYGIPVAAKYKNGKGGKAHGYFIPANEAEAEDCYRSLVSHALNILHRASRYKRSSPLREICGQLKIISEGR